MRTANTYQYWLLDFDDTLATGAATWGYSYAFPKLVRENDLNLDRARFNAAFVQAQRLSNENPNPLPILGALFEAMGWPLTLRNNFLHDLSGYKPTLFEDTRPFLQRINNTGKHVIVVSNNPSVKDTLKNLDIKHLVAEVVTPATCENCQPKPSPSMWDYLKRQHEDLDSTNCIMIGDDPWSDGAFAKNCGLNGWIVDRLGLYDQNHMGNGQTVIKSLADIVI